LVSGTQIKINFQALMPSLEDFDLLLVTLSSLYTFVASPLVFGVFSKSSLYTYYHQVLSIPSPGAMEELERVNSSEATKYI